ncbi:MAG: hypothetical protein JNJ49_10005 [Bdellovibrionaceae bacterium]|nr:hypothetical protein [Pseudobdellovibrionaceae bacterium]
MSTPQCPNCSTALKDDYGMITCPSCGAIVFVDMEGMAHVASKEPEAPIVNAAPEAPVAAEPPSWASPEPFAEPAAELAHESSVSQESEVEAARPTESALDMDGFLGYQDSIPPVDSAQIDTNDPLGLSAYANSEMSGAADGPFVVTVIVSGIDAKDLRDDIRQVLQDPRFGWDAMALIAGIKNGELRLERIAPVKATIVVNRIKHLSVSIRWEQNAITDLDSDQNPNL